MNPFALLTFLLPDGDDPEKMNRWRIKIILSVMTLFGLIILMPIVANQQFAKADELTSARIEVQAVKDGLADLSRTVESFQREYTTTEQERAAREKETAIREIRQQLYTTQRDFCLSENLELRAVLLDQLEDMRTSYRTLTGEEYQTVSCEAFE